MKKTPNWLWNVVIVVTVIVCLSAFLVHYKNWTKTDKVGMQILSGFYYQNLKYSEMDSISFVDKIPPMERLNGFSAFEKEKGVFREFKDSLTDKKVYVYVDNLSQQKLRVVHNDSIELFLNLKDSIETEQLFGLLSEKLALLTESKK